MRVCHGFEFDLRGSRNGDEAFLGRAIGPQFAVDRRGEQALRGGVVLGGGEGLGFAPLAWALRGAGGVGLEWGMHGAAGKGPSEEVKSESGRPFRYAIAMNSSPRSVSP